MKTLFCQQAAEYTYEKFRENVSTAHIMIMVPGQFAEKKYASIESLGLAFCVSGRTRHLSMKESITVIFSLLYYLYRSFALISRVFHVAIFVKECFYLVDLLFTTFCFIVAKKTRYDLKAMLWIRIIRYRLQSMNERSARSTSK